MKCLICNYEYSERGIAKHIRDKHGLSGEEYYLKYLNKPKTYCLVCNKETKFKNIFLGYLEYCCYKCQAKHYWSTEEGRKQKKKLSKHRKNKKRPEISKLMKRKYKNDDEIEKLKKSINTPTAKNKRRKSLKKAWQNPDVRKRYIEGRKKYRKTDKAKQNFERHRQFMLNGGAVHAASFITDTSKPQIELFNLVKKAISTAKLNYPIEDLFLIDIAIPQLKIAFEYDCWYWHQDSKKDNDRQTYIESLGWSFIRYKDFIPTYDQLVHDINTFLFIGD